MRVSLLVVSAVWLMTGCAWGPRVQLAPAPPRDAPVEHRLEAYSKLRPVVQEDVVQYRYGAEVSRDVNALVLAGGWTIYDPHDFLPVVSPDSPTAKHVASWDKEWDRAKTAGWVYGGLTGGGLALFGGGFVVALAGGSSATVPAGLMILSGGGLLLGGVVSATVALVFYLSGQQDRKAAINSYHPSLLQRLDLEPDAVSGEPSRKFTD